ncbi:uncharacterized protein LOC4578430 isoform X1 [Anopheles gambiae]|uniref:uncharacterized protein LOC4578430 isoform X1 n=1 Tax=Anopheles gambiae TaxID=7165 RepID=UPI002AC9051D|nr:uncharacterized protein LOC4578430 isoform X1 [Anopheles gambiae]
MCLAPGRTGKIPVKQHTASQQQYGKTKDEIDTGHAICRSPKLCTGQRSGEQVYGSVYHQISRFARGTWHWAVFV